MTLATRVRREALYWDGLFFSTLLWIVFGALPMVGILIAALVSGSIPVEGEPLPAGFPTFSPPWWGLYLLTALLAVLAVGSLPLPLRGARAFSRANLAILLSLTLGATVFALGMVGIAEKSFRGLDTLLSIQALLLVITVARMVMGSMRLVPKKWRQYIGDDGQVIAPRDVVRPEHRRPWSGIMAGRKGSA